MNRRLATLGLGVLVAATVTLAHGSATAPPVEQQTPEGQQATQQPVGSFKKAFSVCLEAKDYLVKF
ncbi:MAG TPA: hypothetical protein VD788_09180 [Candidatus Polarisedimenticolaceae bacterium]|nr:hypothetical protein [Candidatus Polarisedimenticolaceae bacterium]